MKKVFLFIFCISSAIINSAQNLASFSQVGPVKFPNNPSVQTTGMGRVSQLVYHPTDSNIIFAVTASGGVFKSSNEGTTWKPLCDNFPLTSCASLLINPLNPNIMYLGTGDANYNSVGFGVYKSLNGGITWLASNTGMGNKLVTKMSITPNDTATIIAACSDGIYKSTNSGNTWVKKTTVNTSYRDLSYRPQSNLVIYSASNTFFYRSYDNGETWIQSTINSSITCAGIKLAVCPSDTSKLYCFVWKTGTTSPFGGVYVSNNNGTTFTLKADTPNILGYSSNGTSMDGQGSYNMALIVDPINSNTIYIGAINLWKSTNQGASFTLLSHWAFGVHADKHNYLFSPFNPNKLFICHDGGIDRSTNGGSSWTTLEDGLSASEFYKLGASGLYNDYLIGGLQDNGMDISLNKIFSTVRGGDWGGDFAFDAFDSSMLYEHGGLKRNIVSNATAVINGHGGIYLPHPNDSNTMFELDTNVLRTNNLRANPASGVAWSKISFISGTVSTGTKCMAYSKSSTGTFYVFFSPQLFYKSININAATPAFTQITTFPFNTSEAIIQIETCDYDSNTLYVLTNQTRIYKSINKGSTWVLLNKNLPSNQFIKFELDQKATDSSMYICSAFGVYYRNNILGNWIPFSQGLPTIAQITDMEIMSDGTNKSRLSISTYGRGIWQSNIYNNLSIAPIADFMIQPSSTQSCSNTFILVDNSINSPTTHKWNIAPASGWSFINGTDSLSSRAEIQFNTTGTYFISLTVSNNSGINIKTVNYNYSTITAATCVTSTTNPTGYDIGIKRFEFNAINNPSSIGVASNQDFSCNNSTIVKAGTTYTAWVTTGSTNNENQKIYIDYNRNGVFTDVNELVGTIGSGMGRRSCSITILSSPPSSNQFLRMRVVSDFSTSATPSCGVLSYGESEDYAIYIDSIIPSVAISIPKPIVNGSFIATFTSSENIYGFDNSDISVFNGASSNFVQSSPNAFSATITPVTFGKIVITINANSFTDIVGNSNVQVKDSNVYSLPLIETTIISKTQNFGPNETDTFYSSNGKIMAVLINNSSFNYGATTVSIDSSGTGAINYSTNTTAAKKIAKKTYTVIPTNNNSSGNYSIRLFYTAAELTGWKSATGNNFSSANIIKCPSNIASGTISNGVYGTSVSMANYGGTIDSVITSTFSTGFSGFAIGANIIVLPVSMLSFEANKINENVKLTWSTASEMNNDYFDIERSVDGGQWISIAKVKGNGTKNSISNYIFIDHISSIKHQTPYIYYRLKQTDFNGAFIYSATKTIEFDVLENTTVITPQPAKDFIKVRVNNNSEYRYVIIDASGKVVLKGSSSIIETEINISTLASGLYYLQIQNSLGSNEVLKFIKGE